MSSNPYKDYYEAMNSSDEWSRVRAAEAKKRIDDANTATAFTGEEPNFDDEYNFSGGM